MRPPSGSAGPFAHDWPTPSFAVARHARVVLHSAPGRRPPSDKAVRALRSACEDADAERRQHRFYDPAGEVWCPTATGGPVRKLPTICVHPIPSRDAAVSGTPRDGVPAFVAGLRSADRPRSRARGRAQLATTRAAATAARCSRASCGRCSPQTDESRTVLAPVLKTIAVRPPLLSRRERARTRALEQLMRHCVQHRLRAPALLCRTRTCRLLRGRSRFGGSQLLVARSGICSRGCSSTIDRWRESAGSSTAQDPVARPGSNNRVHGARRLFHDDSEDFGCATWILEFVSRKAVGPEQPVRSADRPQLNRLIFERRAQRHLGRPPRIRCLSTSIGYRPSTKRSASMRATR